MPDQQVPVNAVAEAQAMLPINQPPPAAAVQPDDVSHPVPAAVQVEGQVRIEANELSLEVCKLIFVLLVRHVFHSSYDFHVFGLL